MGYSIAFYKLAGKQGFELNLIIDYRKNREQPIRITHSIIIDVRKRLKPEPLQPKMNIGKSFPKAGIMSKKIIVYTTSWCGDCHKLKAELKEHAVAYEERDIEKNENDYKAMMGFTNGKRVIPTVDIEGKILINPRFSQVAEALDIQA